MADMVKSMFAARDVPWHGKGVVLGHVATSGEAIVSAGLDWVVEKVPNLVPRSDGSTVVNPYSWAIVRRDTGEILGSVGSDYTPLQNRNAFKHLDSIVGEAQAVYETAGVLYDAKGAGSRIWILAKLPWECVIARDDVVLKYLLLTHGHNGFEAVQMLFTPIQVVCSNTLNLATSDRKLRSHWLSEDTSEDPDEIVDRVWMKHTQNLEHNLDRASKMLGVTKRVYGQFEEQGNAMARFPLETDEACNYFMEIAGTKQEKACEKRTNEFLELYEHKNQLSLPEARGSLWTAYSATTEWIDWFRPQRNPERNLESVWMGAAAQAKKKAYVLAADIMTGKSN